MDRNDWPATWKYHDRDRVRLLELLAEYGIGVNSSESVVFITGDHGDSHPYMDWRGEYGHGQPESSWWQQKVSVPLWMCLPNPLPASRSESGEATRSSQRDRSRVTEAYASAVRGVSEWYREPLQRLELQPRGANDAPLPFPTGHVDVMPTVLAVLGTEPQLPSAMFSSGYALTVGVSHERHRQLVLQRGVADDSAWSPLPRDVAPMPRSAFVMFNPRHFPERDKIAGVASADTKLWFRVKSYDASGHVISVVPERLSDGSDDVNWCNGTAHLRSVFSTRCDGRVLALQGDSGGVVQPGSVTDAGRDLGDNCTVHVDQACDGVLHIINDFWRFLNPRG